MHPPRHSPPATDGPTDGPRAAALSRALFGVDLMPWQQLTLDRALARDPSSGRYLHRTVVVTVPRQNGKSHLLRAVVAERLLHPGATIGAAAQDRQGTVETLFRPLAEALGERSAMFGTRAWHGQGMERLLLTDPRLRSGFYPLTPNETAGHGRSLDLAIIDEAWAQYDHRLAQAIAPTQVARPDPQFWIVSTAGVAASTFLRGMIDRGRDGDAVALFDWSADDDADADDPDAWAAANPALGTTITADALAAALAQLGEHEFRRAHLNQWTAAVEGGAIAPDAWAACLDPAVTVAPAGMAFGFDVAQDRSGAAIAAASTAPGGRLVVELVDQRPGVSWLLPRLAELRDRHRPVAIVANNAGQARAVIEEAGPAGLDLDAYRAGDYVAACQVTFDAITDRRLAHRGQLRLDDAVRNAARRRLAGSWVWAAGASAVDIAPLVAATLAAHRASRPAIVPILATA